MATRPCVVTNVDENTKMFEWTALTTVNVDGEPIPDMFSDYADRTVQLKGTLGAAGAVQIQGSLDGGTTYAVLNDPFGTALTMTALAIKGITEVPRHQRPYVSAGEAGVTSLGVIIIARRGQRYK